MSIENIVLKSKLGDYSVTFNLDANFLEHLCNLSPAFFIIDNKVWDLYKHNALSRLNNSSKFILEVKEENKNLDSVNKLYDAIIAQSPKKNMTVVSIGGGITQDITGFFASTLYRGLKWIFVPTTLLAQADSCIGAKTSLNYKNYKNLIGTFYPPREVHIYTDFLKTLTKSDFMSGIGEIAKLHIIGGESKVNFYADTIQAALGLSIKPLSELIFQALCIKREFIEKDEFDGGIRNMLNYGHCFGHAIETATNFEISHGLSVVLGMECANFVSQQRKRLSSATVSMLEETILLPILKEAEITQNSIERIGSRDVIEGMKKDKKRTGTGLPLIMLTDNYKMEKADDLSEAEVLTALEYLNGVLL